MGIAVCGTHYSGMCAAAYEEASKQYSNNTYFLINGESASSVASHGSLFVCFILLSGVHAVVRQRVMSSSCQSKVSLKKTHGPSQVSVPPPSEHSLNKGSHRTLVSKGSNKIIFSNKVIPNSPRANLVEE